MTTAAVASKLCSILYDNGFTPFDDRNQDFFVAIRKSFQIIWIPLGVQFDYRTSRHLIHFVYSNGDFLINNSKVTEEHFLESFTTKAQE